MDNKANTNVVQPVINNTLLFFSAIEVSPKTIP